MAPSPRVSERIGKPNAIANGIGPRTIGDVGLGVDGLATLTGNVVRGDFAGHVVVGLDVLLARDLTLGFAVRPALVFTMLDTGAFWLEAGARLQWLFPI